MNGSASLRGFSSLVLADALLTIRDGDIKVRIELLRDKAEGDARPWFPFLRACHRWALGSQQ